MGEFKWLKEEVDTFALLRPNISLISVWVLWYLVNKSVGNCSRTQKDHVQKRIVDLPWGEASSIKNGIFLIRLNFM